MPAPATARSSLSDVPRCASELYNIVAAGLEPDPELDVDEWADKDRWLAVESSPYPGRWRTSRTPYLREPMQCVSLSHPCKRVTVRKGAQLGFTDIGINLVGHGIDAAPAPMMVVCPTVDLAKAYNREKFDPAIKATPNLRLKVRAQRSRSADGSTTMFKKFPGGFVIITGANSSAGLQMRSVKVLIKEELSEWPYDVDGRGDPDNMAEARTDAFSDVCKIYEPSTPGIEGLCRISKRYEASDQRRYYVPCPHCGHEQTLEWERLKWRAEVPHQAHYECAGCEQPIPHHAKGEMLARGRWIAERPGPGREPGFDISQLYSPFVSWDVIVDKWLDAKGDPRKERVFYQQVLGRPWREQGEAPEPEKLWRRRGPHKRGVIPPGALLITMGVDLGRDYFKYEVVAWGVGKTSWSVDAGTVYCGDTANLESWKALDEIYARQYPDWLGVMRGIDVVGVDSGYNTHVVYQWCRSRSKPPALALDGRDGPGRPPLGQAKKVDINVDGRVVRKGAKIWPVGTWMLKAELYANLRIDPPEDGAEQYPIGYCHFSEDRDLDFFHELTNEVLATDIVRDREVRRWKKLGPNHFLDCRVYAMAALEFLGVSRWSLDDWSKLARQREAPAEAVQRDLEALWSRLVPPQARSHGDAMPPSVELRRPRRRRRVGRSRFMS